MSEERDERFVRMADVTKAIGAAMERIEGRATSPPEWLAPYDGGPALRRHSIPGWWQVWSGGLCIALLRPEDVAPLRAETTAARKEKP